jgi:hypothetical protein
MKLLKITIITVYAVFLFSCSREANNSEEFVIETNLIASGPLFEGSNTCQSEISVGIRSFLTKNNIKEEQVVNVKLISSSVKKDSTVNADLLESINLQLFSDNFPMQNIAVANPVKKDSENISLKVADIQENIKSILFEEKTYVVADATIKEDLYEDLELQMTLVFSINYYKK